MEKSHKNLTSKNRVLPKHKKLTVPAVDIDSDEVERVLEHISSPFRWELLEDTPAKPKKIIPK